MSNEIKQPIACGMYEVIIHDSIRPAMILVLSAERAQYDLNTVHLRYLDHAGAVQYGYFCIDDLQRVTKPAALELVAINLTVSGCK